MISSTSIATQTQGEEQSQLIIQDSVASLVSVRVIGIEPANIRFVSAAKVLSILGVIVRSLAGVQMIILPVVIKCWNVVWPSSGIGNTRGTPDTDLLGAVPDERTALGCGSGTGAAGRGRGSPRSVGNRSIMLGGWPAYLSVRDDQLIAAVVNWAFLTSSESRLKQVGLVKG